MHWWKGACRSWPGRAGGDWAAARRGCCGPAPDPHAASLCEQLRSGAAGEGAELLLQPQRYAESGTRGDRSDQPTIACVSLLGSLNTDTCCIPETPGLQTVFLLDWRPKESRRVSGANLGFHSFAYCLRKVCFGVHFSLVVWFFLMGSLDSRH